ncbi:galactose-binding domain-like protein [Baffinella frigidus]|nr:galactose-binding domain-like protein [Cryptophyta sp. CCMP2293]
MKGGGSEVKGGEESKDITDLFGLIETQTMECLNQDNAHPVTHCLGQGVRDDDNVFLQSDCDEQLLITIHFRQVVKLHSIRIKALNADAAPDTVKIFANAINIGFDSAESDPCTQELDLTPGAMADGTVLPLRFVKFQRVNSVSLFFPSNHGSEDQTIIHKIQLFGAGAPHCTTQRTPMGFSITPKR